MNVPNLITGLRIILTPIFIIYLLQDRLLAALLVFILAGISDGAEGMVARWFNQQSKMGAYLDPLADKILLVAAFVVLGAKGMVPVWLVVMTITRDILILLGVLILFIHQTDVRVKPSYLSKATTLFQLVTIFAVLLGHWIHPVSLVNPYLFWFTGFLTISSGLHYMHYWFRVAGEGSGTGEGRL
jgi:cardiolipin synthase (CMP-forming)